LFSWTRFELEAPDFVTYLCWRGVNPIENYNNQSNGFLVCAEESVHVFHITHAVDHDTDKKNLSLELLQSIKAHDKSVNMCTMLDYDRFFSCSRDPVIKLFNLTESDSIEEFTGHEMSVTAIDVDATKTKLASGGRDYTTRIWDIETRKTLQKRKISRNVITKIRWLKT